MAKTKDQKLKKIVQALRQEFNPSRMFLFGSRAEGTHRPDSDYDFVLVVPGNKRSRFNNMTKARTLLRKSFDVSADVFVYSQREFDDWKDDFSSIPETAMNTGREIDLE
jgi:predicted nucleotidyltransferase